MCIRKVNKSVSFFFFFFVKFGCLHASQILYSTILLYCIFIHPQCLTLNCQHLSPTASTTSKHYEKYDLVNLFALTLT